MGHDYTSLLVDETIGQVLDSLRTRHVAEKIVYFYVLDRDGKLVGVVPTRRLLMSRPEEKVADIMVKRVISVTDSMTVLDACEFFVLYRLLAFPVVDKEQKLIGVVDVGLFTDEMIDSSGRRVSSDVFRLLGLELARGRKGSPWAGFAERFPWLMFNICGGIGCAFVAGQFDKLLDQVIILALFIPVVLSLSEGVGMQSVSLTLAGFVGDRINWKMILRSLRLELLTALMIGVASGTIVGLVAWAWKRQGPASLAIGACICLSLVSACLLGVIIPSAARAMKIDPKFASGPMVLASADIATIVLYLSLSNLILR
jgi:magnesium transporter